LAKDGVLRSNCFLERCDKLALLDRKHLGESELRDDSNKGGVLERYLRRWWSNQRVHVVHRPTVVTCRAYVKYSVK
jgi:hypothetical protein